MKKIFKIFAPVLLALGLSGCFGNLPLNPNLTISLPEYSETSQSSQGGSQSGGDSRTSGDSQSSSETSEQGNVVTVVFLIDYNAPNDIGWEEQQIEEGHKINRPKKTPTSSDAPDPAFTEFLGWSIQPLLDSADGVWNFDTDVVPEGMMTLYIYAVWISR